MNKGHYYELIELFGDGREMAEEGLILDISQQLFEVMEDEGVTRAELASRLDCSKAYVTKLLRGPSNMTLRKVAEVFFALGRVIKLKAVPAEEETEWECVKTKPAHHQRDAKAVSKVSAISMSKWSPKPLIKPSFKAVTLKGASSNAITHSSTHRAAASAKRKSASTGGGVRKAHTTSAPRKRTSRVGSTPARKKSK